MIKVLTKCLVTGPKIINLLISVQINAQGQLPLNKQTKLPIKYDQPPIQFHDVTTLQTTLSTQDRRVRVTMEVDSLEISAISSINLVYWVNDLEKYSIQMLDSAETHYGYILGQQPGTKVEYTIEAIEVNGDTTKWSRNVTYNIFKQTEEGLVVMNGGFDSKVQYHFVKDSTYYLWGYDIWAYGPLTSEMINNYTYIVEIMQLEWPKYNNQEVVRNWIESSSDKCYLMAGDEYLGWDREYLDTTFEAGSFEYDILGITHSYNDVSFDGTSGQELPTRLTVYNELLGSNLYEQWNSNPTDSLVYDPVTLGVQKGNWIDGFETVEGISVFMTAETRGISNQPVVREVNVGISRYLDWGNKIAFMSFDPVSICSRPEIREYGFSEVSPLVVAVEWFMGTVNVNETKNYPLVFSLIQNYPNPFNPSTTLSYSIPEHGMVELKVYDVLGREVATLVNKEQSAGSYQVQFTSNNYQLTSGVYFYKLQSGGFFESRKMVLLK